MFCIKCGAELKRGRCAGCGYVDSKYKRLKKRLYIIIAAAVVVVLGAGSFLTVYLVKDAKYKLAIKEYDSKNLILAAQKFEELRSFKDSETFLEDCNMIIAYIDAVRLYECQDFQNALELFEELDRYEDSKEYRKLCRKNIEYIEAVEYFETEKYSRAKRIFEDMPEFKDCADMALLCEFGLQFEDAMDKIDKREFSEANEVLAELQSGIEESSLDVDEIISEEEINYYRGICLFSEELYYSAHLAFNTARQYMDASQKAKACVQQPVTSEFYRNSDYSENNVTLKYYVQTKPYREYNAHIKLFDKNGTLVSISYIAYAEELTIYLPSGSYYYETCYGNQWFGEKEYFGKAQLFIRYEGFFILEAGEEYCLDF